MNTGQMMLGVGAMVLLSIVVLRVNNSFLLTNSAMMESKFDILASSLAQSVIEEAENKHFDKYSIGNPITDVSSFTPVDSLGPDSEVYSEYNDFDDFNGYTRDVTNLPSANFHISCTVNYVNPANPDVISNSKQWSKKITVTVSSISSQDTIKIASIFSYWYF